jgi:hypothetical protein
MTVNPLHQQLVQQGFVVLRKVYDDKSLADVSRMLNAALAAQGPLKPDLWGVEVVPLLSQAPDMRQYLEAPALTRGLEDALNAPVERIYDGARFTSLGGGGFLPWHFHAHLAGSDGRWDPDRPGAPTGLNRVIASAYVDGATVKTGTVWVMPRAINDPWAPPLPDPSQAWPGQVEVVLQPGDVAVWPVATYHAAWCHSAPRRIFGGIFGRTGSP